MKQQHIFSIVCLLVIVLLPHPAVSEEDIPVLIEDLKRDGKAVLEGKEFEDIPVSIRTLIQIGEPAVPALTGLLEDTNPWVRWQAAWALAEMASVNGAKIMELNYGVKDGCKADLIILNAFKPQEVLNKTPVIPAVIKDGVLVSESSIVKKRCVD